MEERHRDRAAHASKPTAASSPTSNHTIQLGRGDESASALLGLLEALSELECLVSSEESSAGLGLVLGLVLGLEFG